MLWFILCDLAGDLERLVVLTAVEALFHALISFHPWQWESIHSTLDANRLLQQRKLERDGELGHGEISGRDGAQCYGSVLLHRQKCKLFAFS
jgi:hypothetical protein